MSFESLGQPSRVGSGQRFPGKVARGQLWCGHHFIVLSLRHISTMPYIDTKYYVRVSISANVLLDPVISQILSTFYYCLIMHICENAFDE